MEVNAVAHTGGQANDTLRMWCEMLDLAAHQVNDVVGDRRHLVWPATMAMISRDKTVLRQRLQELGDKERVAICLALEECREWICLGALAMERCLDERC